MSDLLRSSLSSVDSGTKPTITLMTVGAGSMVWERHGHIAIGVHYPDPKKDVCYNYGIGDYHHPVQMVVGFFRGEKSFWVGKSTPQRMLDSYIKNDRSVWVQRLPLSDEETDRVLSKLEHDALEQNKFYPYDHFWDNCTTRVRDLLDYATLGKLSAMTSATDDRTYRDFAREGLSGTPWALLATDLIMGRATDRVPTYFERMFLPECMREAVAKLWGIGAEPIPIYQRQGPAIVKEGSSGRLQLLIIILIMTSPAWMTRLHGRFQQLGLTLTLLPCVLLGIGLWTVAIASPISYVRFNESCLIFLPTDLALILFRSKWRRFYARARVVSLASFAVALFFGIFKQPLFVPLVWPLIPSLVVSFTPRGRSLSYTKETQAYTPPTPRMLFGSRQ